MPITRDEFRSALSRFPSGITVITSTDSSGVFHGITVSAFCSVSLEPPLILACIEKTTSSHDAIAATGTFAANVLAAQQEELSERFAIPFTDKFIGVNFRIGLGGVPVLDDALVALECNLHQSYDGGDHTIFVGEVERVQIRDGDPLVYFHGNYRDLLQS